MPERYYRVVIQYRNGADAAFDAQQFDIDVADGYRAPVFRPCFPVERPSAALRPARRLPSERLWARPSARAWHPARPAGLGGSGRREALHSVFGPGGHTPHPNSHAAFLSLTLRRPIQRHVAGL